MNAIDVVVIDKTGTVTEGKPSVEKVVSVNAGFTENKILERIVALNSSSEHPLAQATLRYGEENKVKIQPIADFEAVTGKGVTGSLGAEKFVLGNRKLMEHVGAEISPELDEQVKPLRNKEKQFLIYLQGKMQSALWSSLIRLKRQAQRLFKNCSRKASR